MHLFKVIIQPIHFLHMVIQWLLKLNHRIQIIDNQQYSHQNVVLIHLMMISYDDEIFPLKHTTLYFCYVFFLLAHIYCCLLNSVEKKKFFLIIVFLCFCNLTIFFTSVFFLLFIDPKILEERNGISNRQ